MRAPTPRPATWSQNLSNTRPAYENYGDDMEVDPSPATRDANEVRRMQRTPGATVTGFAKGGKVKATGPAKVHKGEQVIRKAAAKKYGDRKMAAVNKGTAKVTAPSRSKRT